MQWVELALCYNGLLALCFAMPKHARQLVATPPADRGRRLWKIGGWLVLAAAFAVSVTTNGWAFGPIEWIGMVSAAGLALVLIMPFAPRIAGAAGILLLGGSILLAG